MILKNINKKFQKKVILEVIVVRISKVIIEKKSEELMDEKLIESLKKLDVMRINIDINVYKSEAFKHLGMNDIVLYLYARHIICNRHLMRRKMICSNEDDITSYIRVYGFREDEFADIMSERSIIKGIDSLIEFGFIEVMQNEGTSRKETIYEFSDMWKCYGTEKFNV